MTETPMNKAGANTDRKIPDKDVIDSVIQDPAHPVILFSLGWCSYCRSTKQLLTQLGVPFHSYELDAGEFLEPALQHAVRTRLQQLTRSSTLPQLFISGESIGGYTDTYAAWKSGRLEELLVKHKVPRGHH
jgi:glutaredoxin